MALTTPTYPLSRVFVSEGRPARCVFCTPAVLYQFRCTVDGLFAPVNPMKYRGQRKNVVEEIQRIITSKMENRYIEEMSQRYLSEAVIRPRYIIISTMLNSFNNNEFVAGARSNGASRMHTRSQ